MSADTDLLRATIETYVPDGFRDDDGVWHDGPHMRDNLVALARLEAAEQQRDTLAEALREVLPVIEDETFHPGAAETSFGVHGCEPCRVRQVVLDALASVEPRVPTEGRAR